MIIGNYHRFGEQGGGKLGFESKRFSMTFPAVVLLVVVVLEVVPSAEASRHNTHDKNPPKSFNNSMYGAGIHRSTKPVNLNLDGS